MIARLCNLVKHVCAKCYLETGIVFVPIRGYIQKVIEKIFLENLRTLIDKYDDGKPSIAAEKRKLGKRGLAYYHKGERTPPLDILEGIANAYGLEAWQLLVPGLDPSNPPSLRVMTQAELDLYAKLKSTFAELDQIKK